MEKTDWMKILEYQYELHHFSRTLLAAGQKQTLTVSERELLSLLYLKPEENTPLALSKSSGMKKEAVSRCIKKLCEEGFIEKKKSEADERSFLLSLTEKGNLVLAQNYEIILKPLYELRRKMGSDFDSLFDFIRTANQLSENKE